MAESTNKSDKKQTRRYTLTERTQRYIEDMLCMMRDKRDKKTEQDAGSRVYPYRSRTLDELRDSIEALSVFADSTNCSSLADFHLTKEHFKNVFTKEAFTGLIDSILGSLSAERSYTPDTEQKGRGGTDPYHAELALYIVERSWLIAQKLIEVGELKGLKLEAGKALQSADLWVNQAIANFKTIVKEQSES